MCCYTLNFQKGFSIFKNIRQGPAFVTAAQATMSAQRWRLIINESIITLMSKCEKDKYTLV